MAFEKDKQTFLLNWKLRTNSNIKYKGIFVQYQWTEIIQSKTCYWNRHFQIQAGPESHFQLQIGLLMPQQGLERSLTNLYNPKWTLESPEIPKQAI